MNDFKCFYLKLLILFNLNHLFALTKIFLFIIYLIFSITNRSIHTTNIYFKRVVTVNFSVRDLRPTVEGIYVVIQRQTVSFISTLQCCKTREMLEAEIETWLIFTPVGNSTVQPQENSAEQKASKRICIIFYFVLFTYERLTATKSSIHTKKFALSEWQPLTPSPKCSTPSPS